MQFQSLRFTRDGAVARLTLDQPRRGNPIDQGLADELCDAASRCDADPAVRCVLIDSEGPYFGVGADLKSLAADRNGLPLFTKSATASVHAALSRFARMNAPVVVAVHALAVGGFVALCAAADFCLAARSAHFYAAYTGIGLVPDAGGTTFIPRRVGVRTAAEFFMCNQTWTAQTALERGLVNRIVDDDQLVAEALTLARELAAGPALAFGEIKNLLLSCLQQPIEAQMEPEAHAIARVARSDDAWRAIVDVAGRRKPTFEGH